MILNSYPFIFCSNISLDSNTRWDDRLVGHWAQGAKKIKFTGGESCWARSAAKHEHSPVCLVKLLIYVPRVVLATEEITVTQQVSHRLIKCQSRLWSQRGTKVNGSHHGDNPLLIPTGIQIATESYATLQATTPTTFKTVHQTSLLHIESNLDRLGLLSPTHDQRSQQQTGQITLQPVLINKSKFLKATHCRKISKLKYRDPWWWRP